MLICISKAQCLRVCVRVCQAAGIGQWGARRRRAVTQLWPVYLQNSFIAGNGIELSKKLLLSKLSKKIFLLHVKHVAALSCEMQTFESDTIPNFDTSLFETHCIVHIGQQKMECRCMERWLGGPEGLLEVVSVEVTAEGIRTVTCMERWRKRIPDVGIQQWSCECQMQYEQTEADRYNLYLDREMDRG